MDQLARTEIEQRQNGIVAHVQGEIDASDAHSLESEIIAAVPEASAAFVLELTETTYMDSAGIAVLLGAATTLKEVHVRDPSPAVRRVIEITGLTDVLFLES